MGMAERTPVLHNINLGASYDILPSFPLLTTIFFLPKHSAHAQVGRHELI